MNLAIIIKWMRNSKMCGKIKDEASDDGAWVRERRED